MQKLFVLLSVLLFVAFGNAGVIYNSILSPLPPSSPSLGYQATSTSGFGDRIAFAGTERNLDSVSIVFTTWAYESTYQTVGTTAGWNHNLNLNLYNVGGGGSVGSLVGAVTINELIPWRPEPSQECGGNAYSSDGSCYNGYNFVVTFAFGGLLVPNEIIYEVQFDTQSYGVAPMGTPGPYNSLNVALSTEAASIGGNPDPGTLYWNSTYLGRNPGLAPDTGWGDYLTQAEFRTVEAPVPEPGTWLLSGLGLLALGLWRRQHQR